MYLQKIDDQGLPKASGNYNYGVKIGDFIYLSMMLPKDENEQISDNFEEQVHQVMRNIRHLLELNNLEMHHIVKMNVYVDDINNASIMNEIYGMYFDEGYTLPARSLVEVKSLPLKSKVAIDGFAIDTLALERQAQQGGCCGGNCHNDEGCSNDCDCHK